MLAALAFISVTVPDLDGATIKGFLDDWEGVALLAFAAQEQYLRSDRHLMDVFYRIVDADETLKNRTSGIYFNGFLTTLRVDFAVVAGLAAAVHLLVRMLDAPFEHVAWAIGLGVGSGVVYLLLVTRSIKRHKDLSNPLGRW